jgi:nucleoside phosphorylase
MNSTATNREPSQVDFLLTFAVKEEAKTLAVPSHTKVILTGMGRGNAEAAIYKALEQMKPKMVLTCGFAGGLNPILKPNEIVFEADETLALKEKLLALKATPVQFFCARRVAITAEEKQRLWRATGLDVVEMESDSIREICREKGIPAATIRIISDTAEDDLPLDFNKLMGTNQNINYKKLGWALIRSPGKLMDLLAFQQKTVDASKTLCQFLQKLIVGGVPL